MGNKRDHTTVMDLPTSPYGDFIMDDREMLFHSIDECGDVFSPHRRGAVSIGRGRSVEVGLAENRRAVTPPGV